MRTVEERLAILEDRMDTLQHAVDTTLAALNGRTAAMEEVLRGVATKLGVVDSGATTEGPPAG